MRRRSIDLIILLIVLIIGAIAVLHAQKIGDWVHSKLYNPSADAQKLAQAAGMNQQGSDLFYRFEPAILDQNTLTDKCGTGKLGCTEGRSIFILQPTGDNDNGAVVTAAHEMLHVAYSRMSGKEQAELEPLLDAELARPVASRIMAQLKDYSQEDYYNEAHSYIGSELGGISPQLEEHYHMYFADRSKTVQAYAASPDRQR